MKKQVLTLITLLIFSFSYSQTINTVGNSFSPDTLIVNVGDTINFVMGQTHNAVEVSQSTFIANGTTSNGGFNIGFGQTGTYIPTTVQSYYYVCQPHVAIGMKGVIIANAIQVPGCTDSTALNYNPLATINDSSCTYCQSSTIDSISTSTACAGDTITIYGNNLCIPMKVHLQGWSIPDSFVLSSTSNTVVWIAPGGSTPSFVELRFIDSLGNNSYTNTLPFSYSIAGCTDSTAINFNINASCDDGSCIYPLPPHVSLFFSEYAEGSSNNKYFEIYNPTNDTVDLTNYAFARVTNSPTTIGVYELWYDFDSSSIILPNDVYVVAHSSASSLILIAADMAVTGNSVLSNGDDGTALIYGNKPPSPVSPDSGAYIILDWIGDWNGDPGQGWDVAGIASATANHTLVRKCPISQGDTSWANAAGTNPVNSQWIVFPNNDWTNIGVHNACVCDSSTNSYTSIIDTICNGLSIVVGNNTYDSTGVYSDTLLAFNGCDSIITTTLTVLSASASSVINDITICDGDSVVVGSSVYIVAGSYTNVLLNSAGCDSIIITNLTVQTPTFQNFTICDGDSVLVGNSVYNSTGSYTDTIQSSIGCDSIVHTNLTIYSQISLYDTISGGIPNTSVGGGNFYSGSQYLELSCYESSDLVSAVIYSADTTLTTFEIRDNNGNVLEDLTVNVIPGGHRIYFNYNMSAGLDYELGVSGNSNDLFRHNSGVNYPYNFGPLAAITNSSAGSGFYYFFYDIEVRKSPANYSICDGDSIIVAGSIYTTTGLYTDSLTSSTGCDSLVFTNLVVYPNTTYSNPQNICSGAVYAVGNNVYDSTGIYIDTLNTQYGCDSIVTTTLNVSSSSVSITTNNVTICDGDSIVVNGNVYNSTALYSDTLTNSVGCDSIINTNLTVQIPTYQDTTICNGDTVFVGTSFYTTTGSYIDTFQSSIGCDSIVHTNLTIYSQFNSIFGGIPNNTVGGGGFLSSSQYLELSAYMPSELVSAMVYAQDTTLTTFQIRDDNGNVLDSSTINVIPGGHRIYFNFPLAGGSDYQIGIDGQSNNLYRNNNGVNYPYNFNTLAAITGSSAGGQFYYFFYDIEIKQSSQPSNYSICAGDSIVVGGNVYTASGLYTDSLTSSIGCDSLVYSNVIVSPHVSYINNQTICSGEITIVGSSIYDSTGVYVDTLTSSVGCDSVVTTNLTVLTITGGTTINNQTICFGDSLSVGNSIYYYDGMYNDTLQDGNGCDSIIITTLATNSAAYGSLYGGIPDTVTGPGAFSSYNGQLNLDNTLPSILKSAKVYAQDTNIVTFELRDNNGIVLQDITHTVYPGAQVLNFNFLIPVDSNLHLGISAGGSGLYRSNTADGGNWSYPLKIGPVTLNSANTGSTQYYYFYYDLEIMPYMTINTVRICDGESITINGNVYAATGVYTDTYNAFNGCDSIVETYLKVDSAVTAQISQNGVSIEANVNGGTSPYSYIWSSGQTSQSIMPLVNGSYWVIATDTNGCISDTAFYMVTFIPSGVDDILNSDINIYPNPTDGLINITTDLKIEKIELFSVEGKLLKSTTEVSILLDVKGIYFIKIITEQGNIMKRVVVN